MFVKAIPLILRLNQQQQQQKLNSKDTKINFLYTVLIPYVYYLVLACNGNNNIIEIPKTKKTRRLFCLDTI